MDQSHFRLEMADDIFGDAALFDEFDKEREPSGSFILYEKDEQGEEDRSKIIFQLSDSSSSDESDEDEVKVDESVGRTVEALKKQDESFSSAKSAPGTSENGVDQNGIDENSSDGGDSEVEPVVSKERLEKSTTYKLNFERNKFKRYCNIIDSTRYIHDEESPAVQVIFQNNKLSRKYRTQIESFVKNLMEVEAQQKYKTMQKLDLKNTTPSCTELNDKIPIVKRTDKMWQAHSIIGCSQFYHDFIMDTLGWPLVEYNPSLTDSWDIPAYEQVFEDTLPIDEAESARKEKEKQRQRNTCWNCDGDHMLTDCKMPRNQQNINKNRQAMMERQQEKKSSGPKSERYHKETQSEEKFKPGVISKELRAALGLSEKQLPIYIYKMRVLGYPPGWMEEAKLDPGLAMFDKDGVDLDEEAAAAEQAGPAINIDKIVEYPGFTVEMSDDFVDKGVHSGLPPGHYYQEAHQCELPPIQAQGTEADQYGLPPIQPHQLKSVLKAQTEMQQEAMKRQQEESAEVQEKKRLKLDTSDMDLDDQDTEASNNSFVPPLPPDTPPSKPPPPENTPPVTPRESPLPPKFTRESSESRSDSPSLEELEQQYQLLQQTLKDAGEDGDLVVVDSCGEDSQASIPEGDNSANPIDLDSQGDDSMTENTSKNPIVLDDSVVESEFIKPTLNRVESTSSIQTFGELGSGSPFNSQPGTPLPSSSENRPSFKASSSISKDFGTPILRRAGSYELLPADNNFAVGIEDHIPFENLPDSTGTFDKMRLLIDKIRKKMPSRKKKK